MKYSELELDRAYRVTSGSNGTLLEGDIVWVDSISKALNNAAAQGWLDSDDCTDDVFEGVIIEPALGYKVTTQKSGTSRCEPI